MFEQIEEIAPEQLEKDLNIKKPYVVIDVREDEEVAQGMIPEAKHIPLQQIPEKVDSFDKNQEYVLVCRSGRRSMNACMFMQQKGFKVKNLAGGMLNWQGEIIL